MVDSPGARMVTPGGNAAENAVGSDLNRGSVGEVPGHHGLRATPPVRSRGAWPTLVSVNWWVTELPRATVPGNPKSPPLLTGPSESATWSTGPSPTVLTMVL